MNKQEAFYNFVSSFGVVAYDENSVPDDAPDKRITYELVVDSLDNEVYPTISIWDRSSSWKYLDSKLSEIEKFITEMGTVKFDNGRLWIKKGSPFAQRMSDDLNSDYKRYLINLSCEYFTAD